MDRRKIEKITASLATILLFFTMLGVIFFIADQIFNWDIFPPNVEKVLGFILISCIAIIVSSVLVNVMLNLSLIALNSEEFIEEMKTHERRPKKS